MSFFGFGQGWNCRGIYLLSTTSIQVVCGRCKDKQGHVLAVMMNSTELTESLNSADFAMRCPSTYQVNLKFACDWPQRFVLELMTKTVSSVTGRTMGEQVCLFFA